MRKYHKKTLPCIPVAYSFSELKANRGGGDDDDDEVYEVLDKKQKAMGEEYDFELFICQILYNLTNKEKIVFMFQILRSDGYNIDNQSAAISMDLKIRKYMYLLHSVRQKIAILIKRDDLLHLIETRKLGRRT